MRSLTMALAGLVMLVSGCAKSVPSLLPDNYQGPKAIVFDSVTVISTSMMGAASNAAFFMVHSVDGKTVPHSLNSRSQQQLPYSQGFRPNVEFRDVPVRPMRMVLRGETYTGDQGLLSVARTPLQIVKVVQFTPREGEQYTVKGTLGSGTSAIWLEDSTGKRVGNTQ